MKKLVAIGKTDETGRLDIVSWFKYDDMTSRERMIFRAQHGLTDEPRCRDCGAMLFDDECFECWVAE